MSMTSLPIDALGAGIGEQPILTVHHLSLSQSDRVVWLCEELGIPYELKRYDRNPQTRLAPDEYRALTPFGTAPVITDGDMVLGESAAIVEYMAEKYGNGRFLVRYNEPNYTDFLYWFHFANGSFMPAAMIASIANYMESEVGLLSAFMARENRAYAMLEDRLGRVEYLAGDSFTAADIMTLFPLTTMRALSRSPRNLSSYPYIRTYLQRIAARPAFQRAMQKAEPGVEIPFC
jgi:glutathione S-transferase